MSRPAQRWSELHHGIDDADVPLLGPWLRLMWRLALPLARLRVPPTAVTLLGVAFAAGAVLLAGPRPWIAAVVVVLAGVCDGLDGAIAVVGDAASRVGARADAVADRIADVAFALVLGRCGAPLWAAVAAAALAVEVDLARRWVRRPAMITVAERPSWVICAVLACAASALSGAAWPVRACVVVWVVLALIGLGQLTIPRAGAGRAT